MGEHALHVERGKNGCDPGCHGGSIVPAMPWPEM